VKDVLKWDEDDSVRFQVLTAASVKFRVFWNLAPCSHVEVDRRFRSAYCLHHQGDEDSITHDNLRMRDVDDFEVQVRLG
jgi:hypothetical protein